MLVPNATAPTAEPDGPRTPIPLPRARLVGGCSATNGGFWVRGFPADYDAWAAAGNPGWSAEDLLPLFRAVETDADFSDEWHGADGPVPVQRIRAEDLDDYPKAFVASAAACGHPRRRRPQPPRVGRRRSGCPATSTTVSG